MIASLTQPTKHTKPQKVKQETLVKHRYVSPVLTGTGPKIVKGDKVVTDN